MQDELALPTIKAVFAITVPVMLGALFPDIDTSFGTHRKTFHNLAVLGAFAAFPIVFGNLHYVWIGVATHYVLDIFGSSRGIALFYPFPEEYGLPIGVTVSSKWADAVTLAVTVFELAIIAAIVRTEAYRPVLDVIGPFV